MGTPTSSASPQRERMVCHWHNNTGGIPGRTAATGHPQKRNAAGFPSKKESLWLLSSGTSIEWRLYHEKNSNADNCCCQVARFLVEPVPFSVRCGLCTCSSSFRHHAHGKRANAANRHCWLSRAYQHGLRGGVVAR